jgi:hypothetical protein
MLRTLQKVSGAAFFLLGLSFFAAYVLLRNGVWTNESAIWMQVADLPLALSAVVYGGICVYCGVRDPSHTSTKLAVVIAFPLFVVFAVIVAMNFWPA